MEEIMEIRTRLPHSSKMNGFTLVELMIVIAIISILASLSAPKLTRQVAKANLVSVHNLANQNQAAIEEFIMINDNFPTSSEFEDWLITAGTNSYIDQILIDNTDGISGDLKITLNTLPGLDAGHYFVFSRNSSANWSCLSTLSSDYLPSHCSTTENDEVESL